MTKTHMRGIQDQAHFTNCFGRSRQPMACDRLIPLTHAHSWIVLKPTEPPSDASQVGTSKNLHGYFTQMRPGERITRVRNLVLLMVGWTLAIFEKG
jgi:hypothetical protein